MRDAAIRIDPSFVEAREVDGELVVYDLRARAYLGGNPAATALWPLLEAGTSRGELAEALEKRFGIGPERAEEDAAAFVEALGSRGLLAPGG